MKKNIKNVLLLVMLITGCNSNISSSSSSSVSSTTSKVISSSTVISSSSKNDEEITIDYVINKLNEVKNKSYTLSYSYQGINFNDVFVPNSYYYNDLYKKGNILLDLTGNGKYLYDFDIGINKKIKIINQTYNDLGYQGSKELIVKNLSSYDYEEMREELVKTSEGIKLVNEEIIKFFTRVINDVNTFDYIIFNKYNDNLTFEFYFEDTLYDGYSYTLKNIGNSNNENVLNYLTNYSKLEINGMTASQTLNDNNIVIEGDINYMLNNTKYNFESLSNIKIKETNITKYKLESISNGVSYKQYYTKESGLFKKIGLDGKNNIISSSLDIQENEIFPNSLSFLKDCYLVNGEYVYYGSNANEVISSLLINSSSIIIDAWIKEIKFTINNNKIERFNFNTFDIPLNDYNVYFEGEFRMFNDGVIENIQPIVPSNDDAKIKKLLNSISNNDSNYKLESTSYIDESKLELAAFEKHIINYVDGVYFDANYRINSDNSLSIQFANGYVNHNDKVYSFRYDVTLDKIDNIMETKYESIQDAILSLSSSVLYMDGNKIKISPLVTDVSENVKMLEQSMLIDPLTVSFYHNENEINKITYKYGNSYTSCYVEAEISHGKAFIDDKIISKLNDAFPNENNEIEELYLKDSDNENVLSIYHDLYDNGYNEYADYIPFIPGIENTIDIIWLNDYPEGYQCLIDYTPSNYLEKFKKALIDVYGYSEIDDNTFINNSKGLKVEIKEDYGYQQFYFIIL